MLGSTIVVLDIEDRQEKRERRLVFSGDLGRVGIPIIRDPQTPDSADLLIMESTYGNRLHPPFEDDEKRLKAIIQDTYQAGGMVIMPAFAVGRTQQLVYTLHKLAARGDIPRMPIYVDSPLAIDVTAVYRLHPECYDDETLEFLRRNDLFGFADLTYTRTQAESMILNDLTEPAIIISASGMAEHGRILHHLKNHIEDPRTTVLITGWQAPETLGRRLVEKVPIVRIFGEEYYRKARVEVLNGFSGHADHDELLAWVSAIQRPPRHTFLVHGEPESASALAQSLRERLHLTVDIPQWKQSFEV
jgi:metallo-beta-lactamase family protein